MNRYLDAIAPNQGITLAGRFLPRARLGLHLQLSRLHTEFEQASGATETAFIIQEYLSHYDLTGLSGPDALYHFACLLSLNQWQWSLPFMLASKPDKKPEAYEYQDRTYAWYVHKLASRYSWTREYIFNLWPEEFACYLQEIFVSELDEYEDLYRLHEIAYVYDKSTKRSKYQPLPRPEWMDPPIAPPVIRIHRGFLPSGLVIRDDGTEIKYH